MKLTHVQLDFCDYWKIEDARVNLYPRHCSKSATQGWSGQVWQNNLPPVENYTIVSVGAQRIRTWDALQERAKLNDHDMLLLKLKFTNTLDLS